MGDNDVMPVLFSISAANVYLPIMSIETFDRFIEEVNSKYSSGELTPATKRLKLGIIAIYNNQNMSDESLNSSTKNHLDYMIMYRPDYYFSIFAGLFTPNFFNEINSASGEDSFFQNLKKRAYNEKKNESLRRSVVQKVSTNSTDNWNYDANELSLLYDRMHKNKLHQDREIYDSNTTILRQSQLNYDSYLRQLEWNQFLKLIAVCLCMLIILGYLGSIEFSVHYIRLLFIVIFMIFVVNSILIFMSNRKRHKLMYPRLAFPGYPILDSQNQKKYENNNCTPDPTGKVTCK